MNKLENNMQKLKVKLLSCVRLFATPWTVALQAPLFMELSRQEYWNGLPFPSPGALPHPGIEPGSSTLQADSLLPEPPGKPLGSQPSYNSLCSKLKLSLTSPSPTLSITYIQLPIKSNSKAHLKFISHSLFSLMPSQFMSLFLTSTIFFLIYTMLFPNLYYCLII